jgi:hypothetical protein
MSNNDFFNWEHILPILKRDKIMLESHVDQKSVSMHNHAFLELTYVQKGTGEHILDGQKISNHDAQASIHAIKDCNSSLK